MEITIANAGAVLWTLVIGILVGLGVATVGYLAIHTLWAAMRLRRKNP